MEGSDLIVHVYERDDGSRCPASGVWRINEWNRRASQWVSVEDRLPSDRRLVIVNAAWLYEEDDGPASYISTAHYVPAVGWRECDQHEGEKAGYLDLPVTHWMPLPEPPE